MSDWINPEHWGVLITLREAGLITVGDADNIQKNWIGMDKDQREKYLRRVIKDCGRMARK